MRGESRKGKRIPFEFATIQELIKQSTDRYYSKTAAKSIIRGDKPEYTYGKMFSHILYFCEKLSSRGINKKRVALIGKNSYEWFVCFLAICASGNVAVLIDAEAPEEEWLRYCISCPVQLAICDRDIEDGVKKVFGGNCISIYPHMIVNFHNN